ncbi:sodium-dependent multivitamin transporter isoform X1 [Strongylocentrotus purpuratus]|uniref:Sodium-dependent multivitamin transporter n=1 Tax=Strongylocentrotus purpuratus TaxID=7668 RepID=A0A7M7NR95_STRPU|nr:sodium-dependent multivitamin transporter isoform X1 [Strongylocentrotus purpuratus]
MDKDNSSQAEVHPFSALDYVIFSSMLVVSTATGLYHAFSGGGQKTTAKFLMADRSMYSIPVAISVLASYVSAITILGIPAEIFIYGIQYWIVIFSFFITIPITALVFIPVFHGLGVTSAYEYLHKRFSMSVRIAGAFLFIIQTLFYMAIVLYAPALAINAVTKFPISATVLLTGAICSIYTALGGIKAVIWTDVFQFTVLFGSLLTVVILGAIQAGGLGYVWQYNKEKGHLNFFEPSADLTQRETFWGLLIGGAFNSLPLWAVSQTAVQRFLTSKTLKDAKRSVWYGLPGNIIMISIVSLCGLVLFAYYNDDMTHLQPALNHTYPNGSDGHPVHYTPKYSTPDQILIYFVSIEFGHIPGMQGLFVACLFAGTLSTVASGLNALAAVTLVDIVKPWRHWRTGQAESVGLGTAVVDSAQDFKDTVLSKVLTFVYGAGAIGLAFVASKMGSLVQMANTVLGALGGPILGVFTLGLLYKRSNTGGALIGMLVGTYISLWITIGALTHQGEDNYVQQDAFWLYRVSFLWYSMFATMSTLIVGIIVSEVIRLAIVDERYKRVDPLLLATFLRPKGWHKSISATESHDPGVRIGDTVITRLNDDGILVDEEEEPLIESMDDHNVHEMENVGDNM